jgi:hypothetical protein
MVHGAGDVPIIFCDVLVADCHADGHTRCNGLWVAPPGHTIFCGDAGSTKRLPLRGIDRRQGKDQPSIGFVSQQQMAIPAQTNFDYNG